MQTREYFEWAHAICGRQTRLRSVQLNATTSKPACWKACSAAATGGWPRPSNWPGGAAPGWTAGASSSTPQRWWQALADAGIDAQQVLHQPYELDDKLPWDHVNVKYGRTYLEKEQTRSVVQLEAMADAPERDHAACVRSTSRGAGVSLRFSPVGPGVVRSLVPFVLLRGFACAMVGLTVLCGWLHAEVDLAEARRLVLRGRYEEALEHYETFVSEESPEAALGRARCYRETGRSDRAERILQQTLETHSEHAELRAELALLRLERGAWDAAGRDAAAVLERDPEHLTSRWVTVELSRLSGDLDEAAEGYAWFVRRHAHGLKSSAEHLRWVGLAMAQHARWSGESEPFRFLVESFYPDFFKRYPDYWPARLDRARGCSWRSTIRPMRTRTWMRSWP